MVLTREGSWLVLFVVGEEKKARKRTAHVANGKGKNNWLNRCVDTVVFSFFSLLQHVRFWGKASRGAMQGKSEWALWTA